MKFLEILKIKKYAFGLKSSRYLYLLLVLAITVLLVQVFSTLSTAEFVASKPVSANGQAVSIDETKLLQQVVPENGVTLKTKWQGTPARLVELGLIDVEKLMQYSERYGQTVTPEDLKIFKPNYNEPIEMNKQNSVLVYNILWALGYANKNPVLDYELERYGSDTVVRGLAGSYFSFADLGGNSKRPQGGYNSFELVTTTQEQQEIVNKISSEGAVPSCGNTFNLPDCSCSFAVLALTELGASQGLTEEEIYEDLKGILPYRFPRIYVLHAIYFKLTKNLDWDSVDAKTLVNKEFSSAQGVTRTHRELAQILSK